MSRNTYYPMLAVACVLMSSFPELLAQHANHSNGSDVLPLKSESDIEAMTSQTGPLSLDALESLALANNPTLQVSSAVESTPK